MDLDNDATTASVGNNPATPDEDAPATPDEDANKGKAVATATGANPRPPPTKPTDERVATATGVNPPPSTEPASSTRPSSDGRQPQQPKRSTTSDGNQELVQNPPEKTPIPSKASKQSGTRVALSKASSSEIVTKKKATPSTKKKATKKKATPAKASNSTT